MRALVCIAFVCVACGPSVPSSKTPEAGKLSCENEFHLDALNVTAGGGFAALRIDGTVETKAIRQISDSVVSYGVQAKRLCEEFNAGVLTRDEYSTRSENLRRRLSGVPELKEHLEDAAKSGDSVAAKKALRAAYAELVPDEVRVDLALSFTAEVAFPSALTAVPERACAGGGLQRGAAHPIQHGDSVPSGSLMSFRVTTSRPAYVYLFQQNQKTKQTVTLFPSSRIPIAEPIAANTPVRVPHETAGFCVDENDLGMENVYVVASLEPVARLDAYSKTSSGPLGLEAIGEKPSKECARRLVLEEPSMGGCAKGRGLVLEDATRGAPVARQQESASFKAVNEAADPSIVKMFAFEHVSPQEFVKRGPDGVLGKKRGIMIEE